MLRTIAVFREPWEAHLFRLRLDAEGIPAFLADEHFVGVDWVQSLALGGVKVQVPLSASETVRAIWRRCEAGEYAAALEGDFGAEDVRRCPSCGARDYQRRPPAAAIVAVLLSYLMLGAFFPPGYTKYRCRQCGTMWSAE